MHSDGITVPLSKGRVAIIDEADAELILSHKWCCAVSGYAVRNRKPSDPQSPSMILMHRAILAPPPGFEVDHIDRDRLNNRRSNLRVATRSQNLANGNMRRSGNGVFRGVSWLKDERRWRARICVRGQHLLLGQFDDAIAAAKAYDAVAREAFGEFATLNFPDV